MKPLQDSDVVASRHLEFTPSDGAVQRMVHVLLGRPYSPIHRDNEWIVRIEIYESFKQPHLSEAIGADPFQALYLAMCSVQGLLKPWLDTGKLTWRGDANLGFPSPVSGG